MCVYGFGIRKIGYLIFEYRLNIFSEYFQKIDKLVIEYHMADSHPEFLVELKEILSQQNYKIETKKLFSDIGFLYAQKI